MCLFVCAPCAGVPLTPSNVVGLVREVRRWWGGLGSLAYLLSIPESKQDEIRRVFPDEMDQKKQAISYWINTDPLASWRRLIRALDWVEETELADSIRSNAEPLTGTWIQVHIYCVIIYSGTLSLVLISCTYMVETSESVLFIIRHWSAEQICLAFLTLLSGHECTHGTSDW